MMVWICCFLFLAIPSARADDWSGVTAVLERGVSDRVAPGAVAWVGTRRGDVLFQLAVGNMTYGTPTPLGAPNGPLSLDTVFDMASCSKVLATTTAMALLFQDGHFGSHGLDTRVADILPGYEQGGKSAITLHHCLLHNAGLPPDPTPTMYWDPRFGCAGAPLPDDLSFGCSEKVFAALLKQELRNGAVVGQDYVYSDLSFLTLMYVVGTVALRDSLVSHADFLPSCMARGHENIGQMKQCAFEAFTRLRVFDATGMNSQSKSFYAGFLPSANIGEHCAPTTVPISESPPLPRIDVQGKVEDGNAYNMGGIAGHAGVFATVHSIARLMPHWMPAPPQEIDVMADALLRPETIKLFIRQANHSQSSRALGWNTNDITAQPDGGWNASCGLLSQRTFTHVGYTGTQICADPSRDIFTILLTARVYHALGSETSTKQSPIQHLRQQFNDAVVHALVRGTKVQV